MYTVKEQMLDDVPGSYNIAISNIDQTYIGPEEFARQLFERGIYAQGRPGQMKVASIGFCPAEQKWYGWSHRAMCGFGIGSEVRKGDCAYIARNWADFIEQAKNFWDDDGHEDIQAAGGYFDEEGCEYVQVSWIYSSDPEIIPNTKIHGTEGGSRMYPPDRWGNGQWTAKTLEDAKQMACDFAEGVG